MRPDLHSATELLALFADPTRLRLMAVLTDVELTVAELVRITGLTQSRVSTHLGRLREAGLLLDRREGTSTFYRVASEGMPEHARKTWALLREHIDDAVLRSDRERRDAVVRSREEEAWPDRVAGQMEHHYSPGRTWEATARGLLGLLRLGDVLDVGSGDGVIAELLAPRARSITCLDRSARLLTAARRRLGRFDNIAFAEGDMQAMPLPDASFDEVLLYNVLTYAERPAAVLAEAFRVLRAGGRIAIVTLDEHNHHELSSAYQHVNAGFAPVCLRGLLAGAGFDVDVCDVSSRERKKPYFQVVSAFANKSSRRVWGPATAPSAVRESVRTS